MRNLNRGAKAGLLLLVFVILGACQTTGSGGFSSGNGGAESSRISKSFYTPFFDEGDHLAELVAEGRINDAAKLYAEQKVYFQKNREKHGGLLSDLAGRLNAPIEPTLHSVISKLAAVGWPAPQAEWRQVEASLNWASRAVESYPDHEILRDRAFRSALVDRAKTAITRLDSALRDDASAQFAKFDHFGPSSFFDIYPVDVKSRAFLEKNLPAIADKLAIAESGKLVGFSKSYPRSDIGDAEWKKLGERYVGALLRERPGTAKPDLRSILSTLKQAKEVGFEPERIPELKIAFVEITSRTLLKEGQIEFPVAVEADLPVDMIKEELDKALVDHTAQFADYTIIFDVALAKASRRVTGMKKYPARILAGYRTEPNPEYNVVQNEIAQARMEVQNASMNSASVNSQYCYGMGCFGKAMQQIAAGAVESKAREGLEAVMQKLRDTPMTLDIPVYKKYQYDKAAVKAAKLTTVHYYVVDRDSRSYFKTTFDIEEKKNFHVAYGIHPEDPEKNQHIQEADTEDDVASWEEAPATIPLSQLVAHYLENEGESKPLPNLMALRGEMLRDKNEALKLHREQTYVASTQSDPRFDSVVVIYDFEGGLGSGFFVHPDVVMTNYHVVGENDFVEMKLYDGQETFGKVIARDVRLDLALIKVQARGKPVEFYSKREVELGSTIEVIGHPKRLEFSITRGIISAMREMRPVNIKTDRAVLHVQIDAATNPGNSGGPVFLKDKVVSVVSWGLVGEGTENLNFTIHYSEAVRFLEESLGSMS